MATTNDVTGDKIKTKSNSEKYKDGWDRIFGEKKEEVREDELTDEDE